MCQAIAESFSELRQWMDWAQTMPTEEDLVHILKRGEAEFAADLAWDFALFDTDSSEVVGCAGIRRAKQPNSFAIGYWVRTSRTGRGLATAAAGALRDAAFASLPDASRLIITMDEANASSAAIPPKLGFSLLGVEDREVTAVGHTGRGLVWALDRDVAA